jgi:hypothetical protein
MRRRWRGASIALVAVVALGAGCSSSSDSGSGGAPSTSESPSSTAATSPGTLITGDPASALVEATDLGSGWTKEVVTDGPTRSVSETFFSVPACAELVPDAGTGAATTSAAQASYTESSGELQVQYQIDVYPSEADAAAVVELFQSSDFSDCLSAALATEAGTAADVNGVRVSTLRIASAEDLGVDDVVGVAGTGAMTQSGSSASFQSHVVLLRKANVLGAFTVTLVTPGNFVNTALQANDQAIDAAGTKLASLGG